MQLARPTHLLVVWIACAGCGDAASTDAGAERDATARDSGATRDSSTPDSTAGSDATREDAGGPPAGLFGLEWDGTASRRRMLYWEDPPAAFDATYLFKVYQRDQVRDIDDGSRYYTTFFHGHNGEFTWGSEYYRSYYGAHPYPTPPSSGDGKWEISANASDYTDRDDGSAPYVTNDRWYSQAFVADVTGGEHRMRFYIDLPSVAAADTITQSLGEPYVEPPAPVICIGQSPDNGSGQSWGGYSRWEEQNAVIRGIQIYASALTEEQILALQDLETDAEVLAANRALGITSLWYLNMNPRPSDVMDKRDEAPLHPPSWEGTPALEWRSE